MIITNTSLISVALCIVILLSNISISFETNSLIEQTFEGKWQTNSALLSRQSIFGNFINDNGLVLISKYFHATGNNDIIIVISFLDGKYKENWVSLSNNFRLKTPIDTSSSASGSGLPIRNSNRYSNTSEFEPVSDKAIAIISYTLFKSNHRTKRKFDHFELSYEGQKGRGNVIKGTVELKEMHFNISFEAKEIVYKGHSNKAIGKKSFFLFFLTSIAFGQLITIYIIIHSRYKVVGLNFQNYSHFFISLDMIWNILIFINSINMSFNSIYNSIAYATIAFIYFFISSFFEGILFYFTFNIEERNSLIKMIAIVVISIITLFILLLFMLQYPILITLLLMSTFVPQIVLNVRRRNKLNGIPKRCISMFTLNRLFIPLYIRMVPNNMFRSKPNYLFSIGLIVSHIVQIGILYFQSVYGGDCIIPKRFKDNYFNYKVNIRDVIKANKDFYTVTCSICLEAFVKNNNESTSCNRNGKCNIDEKDNDNSTDLNSTQNYNSSNTAISIWTHITSNIKRRKSLYIMMTPCKHYFHIHCLMLWIEKKRCPICRKELPEII